MENANLFAGLLTGGVVLFIISTFVLARIVGKKITGMGKPSKADQEKIERLMATGGKARAMLTSIVPTGLVINNHNVQVRMSFWMEPLDGSPGFEGEKKGFFLRTQFPRQGDIWPAWYDRADTSTFCVGAPGKLDPAQIELYREFGIVHPLDTAAAH